MRQACPDDGRRRHSRRRHARLPQLAQPARPPKLVVAISIDQFSADLFDEYRPRFTGGLARLASGTVYRNGYQGHAATETCPGHSTILTGARPSRTGIIANSWFDLTQARSDKGVYCAEDERVAGVVVEQIHRVAAPSEGADAGRIYEGAPIRAAARSRSRARTARR